MTKFAFSVPVLPGQDAQSVPAYNREHETEYRESRRRLGITMERVFLMDTPMGSFVIAYLEGADDFATTMEKMAQSDLPFDREFLRRVGEVHGFDSSQPPPGPPPEVVGEWWDPDVKERRRGLAFVAPLAPGKVEAGKAFAREAFVDRADELAASRRALGGSGEVVVLNYTPHGEVICVYVEGEDPAGANRQFAASRSPYDVWFKKRCREIFAEGIDFDRPVPPVEQIWDWLEAPVAA